MLLGRGRRRYELVHPADLTLDFLDELADPGGRSLRLLALNANQRGLVILIGGPDPERADREQRQGHDRNDQCDVLSEQPAADRRRPAYRSGAVDAGHTHWITS